MKTTCSDGMLVCLLSQQWQWSSLWTQKYELYVCLLLAFRLHFVFFCYLHGNVCVYKVFIMTEDQPHLHPLDSIRLWGQIGFSKTRGTAIFIYFWTIYFSGKNVTFCSLSPQMRIEVCLGYFNLKDLNSKSNNKFEYIRNYFYWQIKVACFFPL